MSAGRSRRSLVVYSVVCSVLGMLVGTARAQVAPPSDRSGSAAPAAPVQASPAPAGGVDPATPEAAGAARSAGQVLEVRHSSVVVGCRYLGEAAADTAMPGVDGRSRIRADLVGVARARGATHLEYTSYSDGRGYVQSEHARFFDCTAGGAAGGAVAADVTPAAGGASARVTADAFDGEPMDRIYERRPPRGAIGVQLELVPLGSIELSGKGLAGEDLSMSADVETAFGVSATAEYFALPWLAIGVAPGVVFGVKTAESRSLTQIDLRGRVRAGRLVGRGLGISGSITLGGYAHIFEGETQWAPAIGVAAGASYPISDRAYFNFEAGYQIGRYNMTGTMDMLALTTSLLHLGVGVGMYL